MGAKIVGEVAMDGDDESSRLEKGDNMDRPPSVDLEWGVSLC